MRLEIFDVEHGACALLWCDDGKTILIDCGHNVSSNWKPGDHLRKVGIKSIDLLIITNYDEDHVSGLPNLRSKISIDSLRRNKAVSPANIKALKTEDGMGLGIEELVQMCGLYTTTSAPKTFLGVERQDFHLQYPEFDDENNLSLVVYLKLFGIGFLFPGDIEKRGWLALLEREPALRALLPKVNVFVASHHGRTGGICEDIFDKYGCKPFWVVISDKGYKHETQETVPYYRSIVKGASFRGETRHVLTTRRDGTIKFNLRTDGWNAS